MTQLSTLFHYCSVDSSRCYQQIFILAENYYQQLDICLLRSYVPGSKTVNTVRSVVCSVMLTYVTEFCFYKQNCWWNFLIWILMV